MKKGDKQIIAIMCLAYGGVVIGVVLLFLFMLHLMLSFGSNFEFDIMDFFRFILSGGK